MIDRLYLQDFKCFERLTLPVAPLTLLTGFNAGGKSTTIQVLLLLAQTLRSVGASPRIALNGGLVQLGTASEVIRGNSRTMMIGAESGGTKVTWTLGADDRRTATALDVQAIEIKDGDRPNRIEPPIASSWRDQLRPATRGLLDTIGNTVFISAVRSAVGPAFPSPYDVAPVNADVGTYGEYAPWWLAQALDDEVDPTRRHPTEEGTTLRRQVGAWAGEMFPGAEVNSNFIDRTGLVRLELRRSISEEWRRPANIGYGLSYAFPIVVAGLLAKADQTLIIDSPEAHLHPRAQSKMARFLATVVRAGVAVIVETHSDHVLNGTRLAVKDGMLKSDQVAVHFFTAGENHAAPVISASLSADGGVSDWPDGFFDQAEKDLSTLVASG